MIEVRWHGRGGQGGWTAARLLGKAASLYEDKFALAFPSFGPERRGAPVLGFTKIDDIKILDRSEIENCDFVVILDETLINEKTSLGIKEGGKVIINSENSEKYKHYFPKNNIYSIDATAISLKHLGRPITNTAMLAALVAISGIVKFDSLIEAVKTELKPNLIEKNNLVINEAFQTAREKLNE